MFGSTFIFSAMNSRLPIQKQADGIENQEKAMVDSSKGYW
jgi:hypothetical protein